MQAGSIERLLAKSAQFAEPFMVTAGVIGVVGNPLFYAVWKYVLPQPWESLALRLAASAVCLPLALRRWWPQSAQRWLPLYWHFAVMFAVPYLFSLFMFMNHYSLPWVLTVIAGTFLLTFFVHWALAAGMFVAGTGLAFISFRALDDADLPASIPSEIFVVYLFTLFVGGAVNWRLQRAREAEAALVRRLRALSGQNASIMRERNQLLGHFLNNTVIARLRRFEEDFGLDAALARMTRQERRFCAMMQADIRSFTKMFDGENELRVAQLVAQCFSEITSIGQDLAVLKPVGDCIFLYSDVEQSREDAVLNVLALACVFVQSIERVNDTLAAARAQPMHFGIAVHAGEVIYGNLASETLIDPTVIGVNVNRTARLEELTKAPPVRARAGANAVILSEEFVWLVRKAGVSLPGLEPPELAPLGVSVRDFPALERVHVLPRVAALEFAPLAREHIRVARLARAPRMHQAEYSRHRNVEYYYEMAGSGPNLVWTIFINVSPWPADRVQAVLRAHFAHLKYTINPGGERWLALSTENAPGEYDETDVEAWVVELIDRLTGPDEGGLRRPAGRPSDAAGR